MPLAEESYVQVATDGSGKKIRNLKVERTLPDGTVVIEYMQVVAILDADGNPIDTDEEREFRLQVLDRLDLIAKILFQIAMDEEDDVVSGIDTHAGRYAGTEKTGDGT